MIANQLTHTIIGAAIDVHRELGPGLLESAYRKCLAFELGRRGYRVDMEKPVPVTYRSVYLDCGFRADLLVNREVVVELKAQRQLHPIDDAQLLSHLRLLDIRIGLLINFHEVKLVDCVRRLING